MTVNQITTIKVSTNQNWWVFSYRKIYFAFNCRYTESIYDLCENKKRYWKIGTIWLNDFSMIYDSNENALTFVIAWTSSMGLSHMRSVSPQGIPSNESVKQISSKLVELSCFQSALQSFDTEHVFLSFEWKWKLTSIPMNGTTNRYKCHRRQRVDLQIKSLRVAVASGHLKYPK